MSLKHFLPIICLSLCWQSPVAAAFTPDDFNDGALGSQWTFHDSTPVGSTLTITDGHAVIEAAEGSDHWFIFDTHAFIEQDAPTGTNWEIITKIDDFDPTVAGQQRKFIRVGMQLWQDDNHFITMSTLSSADGLFIDSQNLWQFDPQDPAEGGGGSGWLRGATQLNQFPPYPFASIYMKLQSTPRGYRGFMSTDGSSWLECLNIVKNPETPDGLLVNPKIRLFEAGGTFHDGGTQAVTPAKFDFIHMNTIDDPTMEYADDDFGDEEDVPVLADNWQFHPGIGVGSMGLNAGELILTGGVFTDFWSGIEQPTYVYQDAPTSAGYALTTKCSPLLMTDIPYEFLNSYGICLWKDQSNWIFISNQRGDEEQPIGSDIYVPNNRIECAVKYNNKFHSGALDFDENPAPGYLRVVRQGENAHLEYSFDETTWTSFEFDTGGGVMGTDFPIGSDTMQVRLFTKRVSGDGVDRDGNSNPPLDAHFDWLQSEELNANVGSWELY